MSTTQELSELKINYLTQAQYDAAVSNNEINEDEIYLTPATDSGNMGSVTSVGVSNATDGGLSVSGSPVTTSGTISIGHSNVLSSAQTTSGVYPIKIDKNGHISEYGNAVTISDTKVTSTAVTGPGTTYYLTGSSTSSTTTGELNKSSNSYITLGTDYTILYLGGGSSAGTGKISIYNGTTYFGSIVPATLSANRTYSLPNNTGTIALTSDIPQIQIVRW